MASRRRQVLDTAAATTCVAAHQFLPESLLSKFEVHEWRHGLTILGAVHAPEWREVVDVLSRFTLRRSDIAVGGGNKSAVSRSIDVPLYNLGWVEKSFDTRIVVDGREAKSPTHSVDCYKNRVALEVEWNNKDPFYDRDLNNFRLLYDLRVIDVGIIVTRCNELQTIFTQLGRGTSYGPTTTHLSKLLPRIEGGGGGGCPVVVFGIRNATYVED